MFGLLYNFYTYLKQKSEHKITLVLLGLDNAGKTTVLNNLQGELNKEATPTFGFNTSSLQQGRNKVVFYDLGGGQRIRKVWSEYLAEVHGVIYVIDAADSSRFDEVKTIIQQTFTNTHLVDKPLLIFANKQDLPTAFPASDVAIKVGLTTMNGLQYNILPCVARTEDGQHPDKRLKDGLKWLLDSIDSVFSKLHVRVEHDSEIAKQEQLRKKKEREEAAQKAREERARLQLEAEQRAASTENALSNVGHQFGLPNQIVSPKGDPSASPKPIVMFSDLPKSEDVAPAQNIPTLSDTPRVDNPQLLRSEPALSSPGQEDETKQFPFCISTNRVVPADGIK